MIGNLNHVAVAVPDLEAAVQQYQEIFGVFVSTPRTLPDHGVRLAVVKLPNTIIELITPLDEKSPVHKFLEKHPQGGIHHLCYEVTDIIKARDQLVAKGIEVIGDGIPKPGYHENPILFFNPKDCFGTLIELEEISAIKSQTRVEVERIGPAHTFMSPGAETQEEPFEGVGGLGIGIDIKTQRSRTPSDNEEGE